MQDKIINLFSSTFDSTSGGHAIDASVLSCEFAARGYKVFNICYTNRYINLKLQGETKSLKIPFIKKIRNTFINILVKPVQFLIGIINFWRLFRKKQEEKIICFGWGPCLIALLSQQIFNLKNIYIICRVGTHFDSEFNSEPGFIGKMKGKVANTMISFFYKKAFKIAPNSEYLKKFLIGRYNIPSSKVEVLYNPRDEKRIALLSKEEVKEKLPVGSLKFVACGRLTKPKGYVHLIKAFYAVMDKFPCCLIILGSGELEESLKKLVEDLKLEKSVIFLGWQENPYKFLHNSDVFVLSSLWEGFPNVLLEAMICELPIISTDCHSGPREILAPETDLDKQTDKIEYAEYGILVPAEGVKKYQPADPLSDKEKILAEAMLEMLKNSKLRSSYKQKSLDRAKDFEFGKIINKWISALE